MFCGESQVFILCFCKWVCCMRNQIISPKRLFLHVTHYSIDGIDERQIQRRVTYFADKIFYRCRQRDRPSWKQKHDGLFGRRDRTRTCDLIDPKSRLFDFCTQLFTYSPYIPLKRPIFDQCFRCFRTEKFCRWSKMWSSREISQDKNRNSSLIIQCNFFTEQWVFCMQK